MKKTIKRIGIFGGTFDPPHNGHIAIAEKAMKQFKLDRIYFIPAFLPPHKLFRDFASGKQRLEMLKLAIEGRKNFMVSAVELQRGGISYTLDTLRAFKKRFPNAELILIIGADNLELFKSWKSPFRILKLAALAVYKRKGFNRVLSKKEIPYRLINGRLFFISSTEVRKKLANNSNISGLVPDTVVRYIEQHSLYLTHDGRNSN